MFGDSTTQCTLNTPGFRLPELLEKKLLERRISAQVINAGRNGETASAALDRLNDDVLKYKPDLVTVMYGLNDVFKSNFEEYKKSVDLIVQRLRSSGARVLLITCTLPKYSPYNLKKYVWTPDAFERLEKELSFIRSYRREPGFMIYDLHSALESRINSGLLSYDALLIKFCVNQSDRGNEIVADMIAPWIVRSLK